MKTLKKRNEKNSKKAFAILDTKQLFLIKGGDSASPGSGTQRDHEIT